MKTLYIDCGMGAAGDMLTGALLEVCSHPEEMLQKLNSLGVPGVRYIAEKSEKCGITGTHVRVEVDGVEEDEHMHSHGSHDHAHEEHVHSHNGHAHSHQGLHGIEHIVNDHIDVPAQVRRSILSVYEKIAAAESQVHGVPMEEIHFHEVGTMDAVADITAVCYLLNEIGADEIIASPVHTGQGTVKCAHGILPVPAPATALLLKGVPVYSRPEITGELCTPTGAALLKTFVSRFEPMPMMRLEKTGYGMGKKDFPIANCVRVLLGENETVRDEAVELRFNVDDMTAEEISFAHEMLFQAGAFEVFLTAVQMKKGRPGTLFTVLCQEARREEVVRAIFLHTSTLGIREFKSGRYVLNRSIHHVQTAFGEVRRKEAEGYGTARYKYEYDDLSRIAKENHLSLYEVRKLVEESAVEGE